MNYCCFKYQSTFFISNFVLIILTIRSFIINGQNSFLCHLKMINDMHCMYSQLRQTGNSIHQCVCGMSWLQPLFVRLCLVSAAARFTYWLAWLYALRQKLTMDTTLKRKECKTWKASDESCQRISISFYFKKEIIVVQ